MTIYQETFNPTVPGVQKIVKYTLNILQQMLAIFNVRLTILWTPGIKGLAM